MCSELKLFVPHARTVTTTNQVALVRGSETDAPVNTVRSVYVPKSKDQYRTPRWLTELLPEVDLDPCSGPGSTVKAKRHISLESGLDGLADPWTAANSVFCNPPYSRGQVIRWTGRCVELVQSNALSWALLLVKLDPTTAWWRLAHTVPCRAYPFRERIEFAAPEGVETSRNNFCSALLLMTKDDKVELPGKLKRHLVGCLEPFPWCSQ